MKLIAESQKTPTNCLQIFTPIQRNILRQALVSLLPQALGAIRKHRQSLELKASVLVSSLLKLEAIWVDLLTLGKAGKPQSREASPLHLAACEERPGKGQDPWLSKPTLAAKAENAASISSFPGKGANKRCQTIKRCFVELPLISLIAFLLNWVGWVLDESFDRAARYAFGLCLVPLIPKGCKLGGGWQKVSSC